MYRSPVVFLDRWYPRFRNFNSVDPIDVIRVKSYVDSFLETQETGDQYIREPPREQLQIGPLGKQLHSGKTRIETADHRDSYGDAQPVDLIA